MTGPINIQTIVPTKYKGIVATVGTILTALVPYVIQAEQWLPAGWALGIGFAIAALTSLGVIGAPYVPKGAVLAPDTPAVAVAAQSAVTQEAVNQAAVTNPSANVPYSNPWP
jgi:hypothetical protein